MELGVTADRADRVRQHLAASPLFKAVAVAQEAEVLLAVVNPDLPAIWKKGSADFDGILRVELAEALRSCDAEGIRSEPVMTRRPLPQALQERASVSALRTFLEQPMTETGGAETGQTLTDEQTLVRETLWTRLQTRFPGTVLTRETCPRLDLGIDSLDWVTLLVAIEEQCGAAITEERAANIITLGDLEDALFDGSGISQDQSLKSTQQGLQNDPSRFPSMQHRSVPTLALAETINWVNRRINRNWFSLKVQGLDRLPDSGPFILAPNHVSDLDIPIMLAAIPKQRLRQVAWGANRERLFETGFARYICSLGHVFPIDDRFPLNGIAIGLGCLRQGRTVVWFPEAWRSPDGRIQPLKRGIGVLAEATGAAILPVIIRGSYEAMPRDSNWPKRAPVTVEIGTAHSPAELESLGQGEDRVGRIVNGLGAVMREMEEKH